MLNEKVCFVAISGSLRKASYNSAVLNTLVKISPEHIDISIADISELPLFNPDIEDELIPSLVNLKSALSNCSGLIISSPEYAHGISGPMKNTLDWLVSGSEFIDLPIMLINTSPRAHHAVDALKEVLVTMSGKLIDNAFVNIPLLGTVLEKERIAENQVHYDLLHQGLNTFYKQVLMG